jgi:1-acyl-sn-glycerol-3-phosphate acyltransferase
LQLPGKQIQLAFDIQAFFVNLYPYNKKPAYMSTKHAMKIDIAEILRKKASKTKVPKFIVNYLRRIIHEKQFNKLFEDNIDKKNLDFIEASLRLFDVTTSIETIGDLPPASGKYIFASNHPLGGLDGMTIGLLLGREYDGKVRLFTNDLLMYVEPLQEMFIPINKVGVQGRTHAETFQNFFDSDNHLITFPAGMCSRKIKGKIIDLDWKKSFISKAVQYQRDIVPIYFEGRNSNFFYNLAKIRKFLGIKINIEMMYLADEMFKQKGNHFTIRVGQPIPWQTFDKSKSHTQWAQWVKDIAYKMK